MKKLLALALSAAMALSLAACSGKASPDAEGSASGTKGDIEIAVVVKTLSSEYWNYVKAGCDAAAAELGISKTTLWRRMKQYGVKDHYGT